MYILLYYELDSNFFSPIENPDITIDSIHSSFIPMKASNPLTIMKVNLVLASTRTSVIPPPVCYPISKT